MAGPAVGLSALAGSLLAGAAGPAFAQDDASAQYAALLQQIADVQTNTATREFYITEQQAQIERLRAGLAAAESGEAVELLPLLRDMVARLEEVMVSDLPIRVERRFGVLDSLREDIRADDADAYDGFRRAMELVGREVELGLTVGSYVGNNPVNPGTRFAACQQDPDSAKCDLSDEQRLNLERGAIIDDFNDLGQLPDGNYINYGRLALLYLERDSSEGYRYTGSEWTPVSNSELLGLRQNVRIARGESAISTMTVPVVAGASSTDDAS